MSRRTTLPTPLRELAEALGGVQQLADVCGVDARTLRRWGTGELTPSPLEIRGLNALARERRVVARWTDEP